MIKLSRKTVIVVFSVLFVIATVIMFSTFKVNADKPTMSSVDFEESYSINQSINIPSATITFDGKTVDADVKVIFPSGLCYSDTKISLSEAGQYTVKYFAEIDGDVKSFDKTFIVYNNTYGVTSKLSTASYNSDYDAIELNLTNGAKFVYNKVIDLSDNTKNDTLFEFFVLSSVTGAPDFGKFYFVLTDCENPDNYIRLRMHSEEVEVVKNRGTYCDYTSYVGASIGKNDSFVGLQVYGGTTPDSLHKGDRYGRPVRFSFVNKGSADGKTYVEPQEDRGVFCIDYESLSFYTYSTTNPSYTLDRKDGLVCDFDDLTYFNNSWTGFSDGRCTLSVYASNYFNDNAKIFITEIDGHDLSEYTLVDNEKPTINVDFDVYEETEIPQAIVGKEYTVFDYTCFDDYGIKQSDVEVFYNYYSDSRVSVDMNNGKFSVNKSGVYYIVYSATDVNGNVQRKIVPVSAYEEVSPLNLTVDGFGVAYAGIAFELPTYSIESNELYGATALKITARKGSTVIDISNGDFIPLSVGEWIIKYSLSNYSGQLKEVERTLNVQNFGAPVFVDDVEDLNFPKYFVYGKEYTIPDYFALSFNETSYDRVKSEIHYVYKGSDKILDGNSFIPDVESNGDVIKFYYKCNSAISENIEIPVVKTKVNGTTYADNLFYGTSGNVNFTAVESTSLANGYVACSSTGDYAFDFVNEIIFGKLQLDIGFADCNFETFNLIISDVNDSTNKLVFKLKLVNGILYYVAHGGELSLITDDLNKTISFVVSSDIILISGNKFNIDVDSNGNVFNGFSSELVYMSFRLDGVEGSNTIKIYQILNQPVKKLSMERCAPNITLNSGLSYYQSLNSSVVIPSATACDVFDGKTKVYVTVTGTSGQYMTSVDGVILNNVLADREYAFVTDEFGTYQIDYYSKDNDNTMGTVSRRIMVLDNVAPTITLSEEIALAGSVGTKFIAPSATVSDNVTSKLTANVMLISPKSVYSKITAKSNGTFEINFTEVGNWIVRYYSYDKVGNIGYIDYVVVVG